MSNQVFSNTVIALITVLMLGGIFYFIHDDLEWLKVPGVEFIDSGLLTEKTPDELKEKTQEPVIQKKEEPRVIDLSQELQNDSIPPFKTFKEEINWYAAFKTQTSLTDIPTECDPVIRLYKQTEDLYDKAYLASKILEICNLD